VLNDTAFIRGEYVDRFEKNFSSIYGISNSIGVGNGTDAIYLALRALEVGPGDEVITACNSWISTSEVISQVGASVKFVDIESDNYNIDVDLIEEKIKEAEKHADEDKNVRELVETRNQAESLIYATDKAIKDLGDKVDEETKTKVEESKEKLAASMKEDDLDSMKKALEEFMEASQSIGQMAYQQAAEEQANNQPADDSAPVDDDNVVDVDYEEVEEEK